MASAAGEHPDVSLPLAEREREYSPSSCIGGDYRPFTEAYVQRSRAARVRTTQAGAQWLKLAYGALPGQVMDLCLPAAGSLRPAGGFGVLVFIHGGYWQELSARDSWFPAEHCLDQGLAFCALDYTLAPQARVGDIVRECRQALQTLAQSAALWGINNQRIVVAGSSAGAHLAAMTCLPQWPDTAPHTFRPLAAVLLSGVFELQPLVGTSINEALDLDAAEARALSPLRLPLQGFPPTLVAWGSNETAAFKRQSQAFAAALQQAGCAHTALEVAGRNHFDVALDVANPQSPLGQQTLALFRQP